MDMFTTAYVHTVEHNLRVEKVNRRGWLLTSMAESQSAGASSTIVSRLVSFLFHGKLRHADTAVSVGDASASVMSQIPGAA